MKAKRLFCLLFTLVLVFGMCSCGNKKDGSSGDATKSGGETFDGGNISILVPDGWMAFHGTDVFKDYDEGYNPNVINIGKGVEKELDLFSKPYIQIEFYPSDKTMSKPYKELYTDVKDLDPITYGKYTFNAFTAKSSDIPIAQLWTEGDQDQLMLSIWTENGGEKISLDDDDVKSILSSIEVAKNN